MTHNIPWGHPTVLHRDLDSVTALPTLVDGTHGVVARVPRVGVIQHQLVHPIHPCICPIGGRHAPQLHSLVLLRPDFTPVLVPTAKRVFFLPPHLHRKSQHEGLYLAISFDIFLVGALEEKCPTLTVVVLYSKVHFFVHLFNLNYGSPKHTRNVRTSSKTKLTSKTSKKYKGFPLWWYFLGFCFGTMRLFSEKLPIAQNGPPFNFLKFCNRMDVKKSQRNPFYIFRHCDTSKFSIFVFF